MWWIMEGHVGFTRGVNEWQVNGSPSRNRGKINSLGQLGHSWAVNEGEDGGESDDEQKLTRLRCMIRHLGLGGGEECI